MEAELGAVMGHETEQTAIPYEEIFAKKMGFTKVDEALKFVQESQCDWLSVAVGSVHGAIAANLLDQKKPAAKLDIDHISELRNALNIPLVLHGGSGIENDYITRGIKAGIAKINIGMSGTSIIILVGVALETVQQIESQMLMRHYKGFL